AAADDHAGVDAVAAQAVDCALADGVCGELGDESGVHAVVGQRDSHVGFTAAEGELEGACLDEALVVVRLQTDHQFAKGNDFHCSVLLHCFVFMCGYTSNVPPQAGTRGGRDNEGKDQTLTRWMAKPPISSAM